MNLKFLNWLLGRTALQKRNDKLVAQNNRLGLEILELRKMKIPKRKVVKVDGRLKQLEIREDALTIKQYKMHIDSQRQHLIVRYLKETTDSETFLNICKIVNGMTDEQIEAA